MSKKWTDIRDAILSNKILSHEMDLLRGESLRDTQTSPSSSLPPITRAHFKEKQSEYTKCFERLSLAVRANALPFSQSNFEDVNWFDASIELHVYSPAQIRNAVISAAERYRAARMPNQKAQGPAVLKIVGARISGDLDLSKIDIPFSIRLIGCHIQGAFILDRTTLITLDISGCTIDKGVSANYLHTKGALRARRTLFLGPAEFGGAHIEGSFDLTDAVLVPKNNPSPKLSYVADRGIINVSVATFDKDFRLERARIYGGMNMRGCVIKGMLVMNDAVLRCALSHFEIISHGILSICDNRNTPQGAVPLTSLSCLDADKDLAQKLHVFMSPEHGNTITDYEACIKIETLDGPQFSKNIVLATDEDLQYWLMRENHRASESAIRAESLVVNGPIYASGLRASGRLNFKSVNIGGGIYLRGSRIRTARSVRRDIWALFSKTFLNAHWKQAQSVELREVIERLIEQHSADENGVVNQRNRFREEFAIDLESATIGGHLDFQPDIRAERVQKSCDKNLLGHVVRRLCETGEDPYKFAHLFCLKKNYVPFHNIPAIFLPHDLSNSSLDRLNAQFYVVPKGEVGRFSEYFDNDDLVEIASVFGEFIPQIKKMYARKLTRTAPNSGTVEPNLPETDPEEAAKILRRNLSAIAEKIDKEHYKQEKQSKKINLKIEILKCLLKLVEDLVVAGNPQDKSAVMKSLENRILDQRSEYYKNAADFPSEGRSSEKLPSLSVEKIVKCIENYGILNSTLLIGEIRLTNAKIAGGLSFFGMMSNLYSFREPDSKWHSGSEKRNLINMRNVTVEGDIDFRNSVGLSSVDAKKSTVQGSVLFCDRIKYNQKTLRYEPIMGRALFPQQNENTNEIRFERSQVSGDINFLFDRENGPDIVATGATVTGKVQILPARGGLQLLAKEYDSIFAERVNQKTKANIPLPSLLPFFKFAITLFRVKWLHRWYLQNVMLAAQELTKVNSKLDLRNLTTPLFVHPPTAWPIQDGLIITGMNYQSTRRIGPLSPPWRSWPFVWRDLQYNYDGWWRSVVAFVLALIVIVGIGFSIYYVLTPDAALKSIGISDAWVERYSFLNIVSLFLMTVFLVFAEFVSRSLRPALRRKRTMAIRWLLLQRRHFNTDRVFSDVRPSEPYLRAALVLRESGRNGSANEVELERIRQRENALSWRYSGLLKILLKFMDWFIGYGFRPMRGLIITAYVVIISAMVFSSFEQYGVIQHEPKVEPSYTCLFNDCKRIEDYHFHSTLYALDVLVPIVNLGVKEKWIIDDPANDPIAHRFFILTILIRLFGWVAISFVVLSVGARIETVVAQSALL